VDKALALRGGGELVAHWAQLASWMELVTGVALAGLGAGLSVLVAQAPAARQRLLLDQALRLGLAASLPVGVAVAIAGSLYPGGLSRIAIALAAFAGWVAVIPGLVNGYWLGQQRRPRMLALTAAGSAIALAAAAAAPRGLVLEFLVVAYALPALVLLCVEPAAAAAPRSLDGSLRRYVLPGLAVGILSPASMLLARGLLADALSWHEAGVMQALWRVSDWVCSFASGVLYVLYLPRLTAAYEKNELARVVGSAVKAVLLPCALAFVALFLAHRPLLAALYEPGFEASPTAVALVFAGSTARIASWVPLFALYAMLRTRSIAIGELASLPLFALSLVLFAEKLTLELAGALWLASFVAYALFNLWAMKRA
jgi:enterobacterial common antigen flippase